MKITSRNNRDQIDTYGRKLARNPEITDERIEPLSLNTAAAARVTRAKRKTQPKQPRKRIHLDYDKALATALEGIGSRKLESLYYSICSIHIEHAPLLTIGVWAFVESLTALAGKNPDIDFLAYFSNQRLSNQGFGSGKALGPIRDALTRIQRNGNATKHHEISASFDGEQLSNDLATITLLLIKTVESIAPKK